MSPYEMCQSLQVEMHALGDLQHAIAQNAVAIQQLCVAGLAGLAGAHVLGKAQVCTPMACSGLRAKQHAPIPYGPDGSSQEILSTFAGRNARGAY